MNAAALIALASAATLAVPAGMAGTALPRPVLVAGPAHVSLAGAGAAGVRVTSPGGRVTVDARLARYTVDLRGRPHIVLDKAVPRWLNVHPAALVVGSAGGRVTLTARPPRGTSAGDHVAVLLLTTRPRASDALAVRMRLGIVVSDRVGGHLVRRLQLRGVRVARNGGRHVLLVSIRNAGNVIEQLGSGHMLVTLSRGGHALARLRVEHRDLLPHCSGIVALGVPRRVRGSVVATVRVGARTHVYRVRL